MRYFSEHLYTKQLRAVLYFIIIHFILDCYYFFIYDLVTDNLILYNNDFGKVLMDEKKKAFSNAEKQKRYRDRQKESGKKEMRGYLSPEAQNCYELIADQTKWTDSVILSNAVRLTYAAYKNGQIGLLNNWLNKHDL
jgi:hypothetical protein